MKIKINKSQNKIEIIKDDSIKYAKISKHIHFLFFSLTLICFIILKINNSFTIANILFFIFSGGFTIYFFSLAIKNKHINEVLKINLENIKLEFLKDGDIVYSKDIPRWKVLKIKKKIPIFDFYANTNFVSILNRELVDKRPLKIITKDEVFSWGYKVEEEKVDEIIELIKEFWNIED